MSGKRWSSIVCVVSDPFATRQLGVTKAAAIARRCGARLTLLNTFMIPQPTPQPLSTDYRKNLAAAIKQRRERLEKLAARLRRQGLQVKTAVEWDYPAHEAIIRFVVRTEADLLITESHRHGKLARWVLANTDWELMRHCPCPVWFVRSAGLSARPRLLVAVDPSHSHAKPARLDDRLLAAAELLREQLDYEVCVVHIDATAAVQQPTRRLMGARRLQPVPQVQGETLAQIRALADRHLIEIESCTVVAGQPAQLLPVIAKRQNADVLVMGAVSRSATERPVIGHTAEKVIDQIDCDVFVVKPSGFKSGIKLTRPTLRSSRRA